MFRISWIEEVAWWSIMLVVVFVLVIFTNWYEKVMANDPSKDFRQINADRVVSEIQYIKDPQTGLCYVYFWEGFHGGPALTLVPENKIPTRLLKTAKVK